MKNCTKEKGFTPIITLLIIIAIAVLAYGAYLVGRPSSPSLTPEEQGMTKAPLEGNEFEMTSPSIAPKPSLTQAKKVQTPEEALGTNFSRRGVLLRESGSGLDGWYILYDTPGNPATTNPVKFTEKSMCDMGQGEKKCEESVLSVGTNVNVDGNVQQNTVTVFLLKKT